MTHRSTTFVLLVAFAQSACAPGGGGRRSPLAPPDQVWGEAHAKGAASATPLSVDQLSAQALDATKHGEHARCADLAAQAAHELEDTDEAGRARLRLLEARCRRAAGQPGVALRSLSEAWPHLESAVDRAWASSLAHDIAVRGLRRSEAAAFSGRIEGDLANAWLGVRMALLAHERGDSATAAARLEQAASKLEAIGAGAELSSLRRRLRGVTGGARAVGAILPLSGPLRRVGERALRGLLVAGEAVVIRDSAGTAGQAVAAVEELAADPAIVGVIGPLERTAASAAAARAQQLGLPLIALSVDEAVTRDRDHVFRNFVDPAAEARAVARYAVTQLGLRRLAVLRPANGYGKRLAAAFDAAATHAGGAVVQTQVYDRRAFDPALKALVAGARFDALFIPDTHATVALLAPHLAAAGLRSTFGGADDGAGGQDQAVQLLGAGGWAHRDLTAHGADRYLDGAVFAAGWWPDATQPEAVRFSSSIAERGGEPEVFAAYAYDSVQRMARTAGAGVDRAVVRKSLATARWEGAVATQGFNATRNPDAPPYLIRVRIVGLSAIPRNTP